MRIFIYRDQTGRRHPRFIARFIFVIFLTFLSYLIIDNKISKFDLQSTFLIRFLFLGIAQEWIFQIELINGSKLFDLNADWKYLLVQFIFGVALPSQILILFPALTFDIHEPKPSELIMPMTLGVFYYQIIFIINLLYGVIRVLPTEYKKHFIFTDIHGIERFLKADEICLIVNTGKEIIFSREEDYFGAKADENLVKDLSNLDPSIFKIKFEGVYISKVLSAENAEEENDKFIKHLARLTVWTVGRPDVTYDSLMERIKQN